MKFTFLDASALTIAGMAAIAGLAGGCRGDDDAVTPAATGGAPGTGGADAGRGGAGGMAGMDAGGTDASLGGRGGGGTGGTGGSVIDAPLTSDAPEEVEAAAPFMPQILFTFDPNDAGTTYGWTADPTIAGSVGIVSDDRDPTNPAPGSLEFRGIFPPYDDAGMSAAIRALFSYGDINTSRDFTGASRVHFWVRVVSPPGNLFAIQPFTQGGAASGYAGSYGTFITPITDNEWHEYIVNVAGNFYLYNFRLFVVQVFPRPFPAADAEVPEEGSVDGQVTEAGAEAAGGEVAEAGGDGGAADGQVVDTGEEGTSEAGPAGDAEAGAATPEDAGTGPAPAQVIVHIDYVWVD